MEGQEITQTVGRWLYAANRLVDPPGAPWWRLYAVVLGPPVAIVALVELLDLTHAVAVFLTWFR